MIVKVGIIQKRVILLGVCFFALLFSIVFNKHVVFASSDFNSFFGENLGEAFQVVINDGYKRQTIAVNKTEDGYFTYNPYVYVYPKDDIIHIQVKNAEEDGYTFEYEKKVTFTQDEQEYVLVRKNKNSWLSNFKNKDTKDEIKKLQMDFTNGVYAQGNQQHFTFVFLKLSLPELRYINSYAGNTTTGFSPSKMNRVYFNTVSNSQSDIPVDIVLSVFNSKNQLVYTKSKKNSNKNLNTFLWDAKPSKNNKAKLKTDNYVPKGTYKYVIAMSYKYGTLKREEKKEGNIKITSSKNSSKYGMDQKKMIPILTGIDTVDYMAESICNSIIKDNMSNEEKIKAIYTWIVKNYNHIESDADAKRKEHFNLSKVEKKIEALKEKNDALEKQGKVVYEPIDYAGYDVRQLAHDILQYREGNCIQIAIAFKILANHLGFESELVSGLYLNRNGTKAGHTWNNIRLNGSYYWIDVDVELKVWKRAGKGKIQYYYYLKKYKEWLTNHEWDVDKYPKGA